VDIATAGNYAYLAALYEGLLVLNIADPANLTLAGSWTPASCNMRGVALAGNRAYVADEAGGLHALDIADPCPSSGCSARSRSLAGPSTWRWPAAMPTPVRVSST